MANLDADDPVDASDSDEECFPVFIYFNYTYTYLIHFLKKQLSIFKYLVINVKYYFLLVKNALNHLI